MWRPGCCFLLQGIYIECISLAEIAKLRKHIINYSKSRSTYEEYRKAGYSKKFYEAHREEIALHKAAKQAFNKLDVKQIPKVKELNAEYAHLLADKKETYNEYKKVRDEAQELAVVKRNVELYYAAEIKEENRNVSIDKQH